MSTHLDLDAARREAESPDGHKVTFGGEDFLLPAEIPLEILDPWLGDEIDLVALVRAFLDKEKSKAKDGDAGDDDIVDQVLDILEDHPGLFREFRQAWLRTLEILFGDEQWARFVTHRPGWQTHIRLMRWLIDTYGIDGAVLGEASRSLGSRVSVGRPSKVTSRGTTKSTPATRGGGKAPQDTPALEPAG